MSEGATTLLTLVSISVLSALVFQWRIRNYVGASCGAALGATVVIQIAGFVASGHFDAFFPIALVTGFVVGLVIAFAVGVPFLFARRKQQNSHAR